MDNKQKKALAVVTKDDLSKVEQNILNEKQLNILMQPTPSRFVHERVAKGKSDKKNSEGKYVWEYVSGGYVRLTLNRLFGWNWDFQILENQIIGDEAIVKGRLTCRSGENTIIKEQFGNAEIKYLRDEDPVTGQRKYLSIGNDFKAAATDALKKCAAEIGIAADIYNKKDFHPVEVIDESDEINIDELQLMYDALQDHISADEQIHIERIFKNQERESYPKLLKMLTNLKNKVYSKSK